MGETSLRVMRKVKIDGKWQLAAVPTVKGKPDGDHVVVRGQNVAVTGGTFYLDHGHGRGRKRMTCGKDVESVRRALRTQIHVLELRSLGMDVDDAPEILQARIGEGESLRAIAARFRKNPPTGLAKSSISKYANAYESFAEWSATRQIYGVQQVQRETVERWIKHMQSTLDAGTITDKVRAVLAELKRHDKVIVLEERTLPRDTAAERDIYRESDLDRLFRACTLDEYERYQTFLLTGFREKEVAYLQWTDVDPERCTIRVKRKRELGFTPKTYEERTVPVPRPLIELLEKRGNRLGADGAGPIFGTRAQIGRGNRGMGRDKNFLEKLKSIARRSGLNCGHCNAIFEKKPVTCATHPVCRLWTLHKFRHTYATSMLRDKIDIVTVSKWLGHKNLTTTRIYLRALEAEMAQPQVEGSSLAKRLQDRKAPEPGGDRRVSRA